MALKHRLTVIATLFALLWYELIPNSQNGFYCQDPKLSHKYAGDTVPVAHLLYISFIGPLILLATLEVLNHESLRQARFSTVWHWYREYLVILWMVLLTTEACKLAFRANRPHFLHSCAPNTGDQCELGSFIETFTCTNKELSEKLVLDSTKSFPSGHAAVAVLNGVYSTFAIYWLYPQRNNRLIKYVLMSVCVFWSIFVSLSRIVDRRHHWWDVLAGAILGLIAAAYSLSIARKHSSDGDNRNNSS